MSAELLVIVNPAAAGGRTRDDWPGIAAEIRRHAGPFEVAFTSAPGDAARIAEQESAAGRPLVAALGGDGTISEVADGILRGGGGSTLGLLPRGTGGDFRRTLGVSNRLADAARVLRTGRTRRIDAGAVRYTDHGGGEGFRHFVNVASFGMGGEVAGRANSSSKRLGGKVAFAMATLGTALAFEAPRVLLSVDGGAPLPAAISNVCVANARYFGGGMKIAPEARLDDGLFDLVVIGELALPELVASAPRLYAGTHLGHRKVASRRARTLEAHAEDEDRRVALEIDGETPGTLPARFEILPAALSIRVPA